MSSFRAVHPVIEVGDLVGAVRWYVEVLGFQLVFDDGGDPPGYAGLRRDGVEIHLQSHPEPGWSEEGRCIYRFLVDDPDALLTELRERSPAFSDREVQDTPWGTREFGRYDPDGNALFFYRNR